MSALGQDLRFAARLLWRDRGFTALVTLTLALAIGGNSAIFSVVQPVLLRTLPFPRSERLVALWGTNPSIGLPRFSTSGPDFCDYLRSVTTLEQLTAFRAADYNLTGGGAPERLKGTEASAGLFPLLPIGMALGRGFLPGEERPGHNHVVVISHDLWRWRLHGDPDILGKALVLNGEPMTVVGVLPRGFPFFAMISALPMDVIVPLTQSDNRGSHSLWVIGRLGAGVTLARAQAEMSAIARRLALRYPDTNQGWDVRVDPLRGVLVGDVRPALLVLTAAVALVLLIACANVASLLLSRFTGRHREMAIRVALGASRMRLLRMLLTESVLLGLLGGALGLLLALWGIDLLIALGPGIPGDQRFRLDGGVLAFTAGLSLLTGLCFGILPALQAAQIDIHQALKEGSRSSAGPRHLHARGLLVITEVALALLLLIGAGLLIRSFDRLHNVPPGIDPRGVLTMSIKVPESRHPPGRAQVGYYQRLLEVVGALPGVRGAALVDSLPLSGATRITSFHVEGSTTAPAQDPNANFMVISPGYAAALGIPVRAGRGLLPTDGPDAPPVVLVSETAARRFFPGPGQSALHQRLLLDLKESQRYTVVGVLGDVRHQQLRKEPEATLYFPLGQVPASISQSRMTLVVRGAETDGSPTALADVVRAGIARLDPDLPVYFVKTMDELIALSLQQQRFNTLVLAIFAALAVILAAVGVYGVMAYTVSQRTHEIGVRMALGARPRDVLRLVVGQGLRLVVIGVGIGLLAALCLAQALSGLLYEVGPRDPVIYLGLGALLSSVALLSCYIPARKATQVDPMAALRYE